MLVSNKDLAQEAKNTLLGNFDAKPKPAENRKIREDRSTREIKHKDPF